MIHVQLRAFHAVAIRGGFSKAADHLGLTQPAVSDQVRKLEDAYDVQLFIRHNRTVSLTPMGEKLLEITRRYFDMEKAAAELLADNRALRVGHLRVGADAPLHVMPVIADYRAKHPGVTVSLQRGNSEAVLTQLLDYAADVAVLARLPQHDAALMERLDVRPLRQDPLVAFVNNNHPWADRKHIRLKDLANTPLVFREKGSTTRETIEMEFARLGLTPNVVLEVEGREGVREAVALGVGIGFVSDAEFGHDNRLARLEISDCKGSMTEFLLCLKSRQSQPAIAAFLACLP